MALSRRTTLIGLGTVAAGAGVIGASGAFDQVEADRSFEVEVEGDAAALLAFDVSDDEVIADYEEGGAGDNDVIVFRLDDDETEGEDVAINEDAVTSFFEVFEVANNGTEDVELEVEIDDEIDEGGLEFAADTEFDDDLADGVELDAGDTIEVSIRIDTTEEGGYEEPDSDEPYQISFIAE